MHMFSTIAIIALFVQTTFVNGQSRPSEGCASVMAETDCVGYKGCKVSFFKDSGVFFYI